MIRRINVRLARAALVQRASGATIHRDIQKKAAKQSKKESKKESKEEEEEGVAFFGCPPTAQHQIPKKTRAHPQEYTQTNQANASSH